MKLKRQNLPVTICNSICPKCGKPIEYPMFESGAGGDFDTWIGITDANLYRINQTMIAYGQATFDDCLAPIIEHAGGRKNLRNIPQEVTCEFCSEVFNAVECHILREENREVYVVIA